MSLSMVSTLPVVIRKVDQLPCPKAAKDLLFPKRPARVRTWSSPPISPQFGGRFMEAGWFDGPGEGTLTPPITPTKSSKRRSSASMCDEGLVLHFAREKAADTETPQAESAIIEPDDDDEEGSWSGTRPQQYRGRYDLIQGNTPSGYQEYGRGVWSVVVKATETPVDKQSDQATSYIPTSPASPSIASQTNAPESGPLAVKMPIRRDAHPILENEARILTYLQRSTSVKNHIVTFYGFESLSYSLVLGAVPLTLDSYIQTAAAHARENFSTRTMFDPVVGVSEWIALCRDLVEGLEHLHSKSVIHGDIKPTNVLLRPRTSKEGDARPQYQPLFCDFSSSHVVEPGTVPEQVSAVTTEFTAPELLLALGPRAKQKAIATFENDVFALAVTLLNAATGENPYASARSHAQKTAMAMEGVPIQFARRGEQASRVRAKGLVDMVISGAVNADPSKRWPIARWREVVIDVGQNHAV